MKNISEFKAVFSDPKWSDDFFRFLQVIFHLYPEDKFHYLISKSTKENDSDEDTYKTVQAGLPKIKPFLSELTLALPALKKQKKEMAKQVLTLLGNKTNVNGYLEIGSTGRYISELRKNIKLSGPLYLSNDIEPDNSLAEIFERGQLKKIGQFFNLDNYIAIDETIVKSESLDLVTCHIGLHHCPLDLLEDYVKSIHRILKKGALFILRDHDVKTPEMATFVSLVHTVFNLGLNETWEKDHSEFKSFKSIDEWSELLTNQGFKETGPRILQDNDPSLNTLVAFIKI